MIIPAITKTFEEKTVLNIPEIEIPDNEITAILGHNGSGKSTLARILAGIIYDDSGKKLNLKMKVGYMNQTSLGFKLSVRNNILLNSDKNLSRVQNLSRADELMRSIGIDTLSSRNASRLSGGQTQRMALARIMMKDYDLLILDEPTASMDQSAIPDAENMIRSYMERCKATVILITHSAEQAKRLADMTITLDNGLITGMMGASSS